jgi:hypothetical protein
MTFKNTIKMPLNFTVKGPDGKGAYKEVGRVDVPYPVLADIGLAADVAKNEDGTPKLTEAGVPVYAGAIADFVQSALLTATLNKARNRFDKDALKKGEIKLNPGMAIATNWDELTAESERTGEALALRRDARVDFEAYLRSLNKADNVVTRLGDLFYQSSKILGVSSEKALAALTSYSEDWIKQLDPAKATRFAPKIEELQESINAASGASDDDLMA